jgi:mRNA interferase MazF
VEVARGEAWWAALPSAEGPHPVLILTRDRVIPVRKRVTVAPISSTHRGIPVEVTLGEEDGMPHECWVNLDDIVTIPKHLLVRRITRLSLEKMSTIREAILVALGL